MSSTELSLDISHLVARAVAGEAIDVLGEGHGLARKYPELGMSGELIGKAIARAAGMMGVALAGWAENPPAGIAEATTGREASGVEVEPADAPVASRGVDVDDGAPALAGERAAVHG